MAKRTTPASKKVYLVYVTGGSPGESYLLTDATTETFMGMNCIRGFYELPNAKWHFIAERTIRIPYARVQMIVEYDSIDTYKQAVKRHYDEKTK
ncbi:MAG: hypothetical protein QM770_11715 [Tepidisphaeraceae bacterium]